MTRLPDIKALARTLLAAALLALGGCMKYDYSLPDDMGYGELPEASGDGLFIINEGNFMYGNATLSYYDPTAHTVQNEVFARANGMKLGDVAQSMTIHGDLGWIVVNNSHVIFAIDLTTFREVGRITGLTSPRYMHFVSDTKAYVTQIWDSRICIIDPQRYEVTGYIDCPGMTPENASTEQMVQIGDYVYVNCWSYQNRLLKIDTRIDQIVAQLEVGIQPTSLVADRNGKLWTVTDGGYEGSLYGYEAPALYRIDPETFSVEQTFRMRLGDAPSEIVTDGTGSAIYWINDDIWRMDVTSERLPVRPLIESRGTIYYGLTVDPVTSDVYVADAVDYVQNGIIYRYDAAGELVDSFYVGITPGAFCWK